MEWIEVALLGRNVSLSYKVNATTKCSVGSFVICPIQRFSSAGVIIKVYLDKPLFECKECTLLPFLPISACTMQAIDSYSNDTLTQSHNILNNILTFNIKNCDNRALSPSCLPQRLSFKTSYVQGSLPDRTQEYISIYNDSKYSVILIFSEKSTAQKFIKEFNDPNIIFIKNTNNMPDTWTKCSGNEKKLIVSLWSFASILPCNIDHIIMDDYQSPKYTLLHSRINAIDLSLEICKRRKINITLGSINHHIHTTLNTNKILSNMRPVTIDISDEEFQFGQGIMNTLKNNANIGKKTLIIFKSTYDMRLIRCTTCSRLSVCACGGTIISCSTNKKSICISCTSPQPFIDRCTNSFCMSKDCVKKILGATTLKDRIITFTNLEVQILDKSKPTENHHVFIATDINNKYIQSINNLETIIISTPDKHCYSKDKKNVFETDITYNNLSDSYYSSIFNSTCNSLIVIGRRQNFLNIVKDRQLSLPSILSSSEISDRRQVFLPPFGKCISIYIDNTKKTSIKKNNVLFMFSELVKYLNDDENIFVIKKIQNECSEIFSSININGFSNTMKNIYNFIQKLMVNEKSIKIICDINIRSIK
ncbi:MAG: hypothetical protein KAH32_00850 [Chlamydiia bacterium]|nr:hypothetical protein [Chlamydiia bacterium]